MTSPAPRPPSAIASSFAISEHGRELIVVRCNSGRVCCHDNCTDIALFCGLAAGEAEGKALSSAGHALRISLRPHTPLHNPRRSPPGAYRLRHASGRRGRYGAIGSQYATSLLPPTPPPRVWSVCSCATRGLALLTPSSHSPLRLACGHSATRLLQLA